jgi:hypothetical protein
LCGIVALTKATAATGVFSSWSVGLRILPDYGLLTGTKIPPVTQHHRRAHRPAPNAGRLPLLPANVSAISFSAGAEKLVFLKNLSKKP